MQLARRYDTLNISDIACIQFICFFIYFASSSADFRRNWCPSSRTHRQAFWLTKNRLDPIWESEKLCWFAIESSDIRIYFSLSNSHFRWTIDILGVHGTLYENELFQLQFKFNDRYPFESPEVVFVGPNMWVYLIICISLRLPISNVTWLNFLYNSRPVHPHIYSNGHICLSILSDDW